MKYVVIWHARGLGRQTHKTFRSWKGAVSWWAWLRVREQYEARINCGAGEDMTPRWPTRRLRALVRQEQAIQAEIERLQNTAIARAAALE